MLELDLMVSYTFMALLFLRQVSILKRPNKINYAPLMLSIGALFATVHFMLFIQSGNIVFILKESLSVIVIALSLFIIMNILHQAQKTEDDKTQKEFALSLSSKVAQMKEYIAVLEDKATSMHDEEQRSLFEIREQIKKDIASLKSIQANQEKFIGEFETMTQQQSKVMHSVEQFRTVQLPELDEIMHSHIDMLRVSEQDHYNRIKKAFDGADALRNDIKEEMDEVREDIKSIKNVSQEISSSIVEKTLLELSAVTLEFEKQLNHLRAQTEGVSTSLFEGENILDSIRKQSEMVMKQIVLSSNNMKILEEHSRNLTNIYNPLKDLIGEIESVKLEYKTAYKELSGLANTLNSTEKEQLEIMKNRVDELSEKLIEKIDISLEKLQSHYHIASREVTSTVSELAKKAKVQSGYELK
ncbi:hypothetical protein [Sulfurimonas sp. HSL-1716]|uniref:hypothetical protein n=1 Tax=Hydrocurvibacter sulfurireducens TaxID=3131937 RepID=UPI0031F8AF01